MHTDRRPSRAEGRRRISLLAAILLLAACAPAAAPANEPIETVFIVRRLATAYVSPTPGEEDRRLTQIASRPTATIAPLVIQATPTVYIGVFLGASSSIDAGLPVIDPARYEGTLAPPVPTLELPACPFAPDPVFGTTWASDPAIPRALGCAGEPVTPYIGSIQFFERGIMYWLPTGEIFAIAPAAGGGRFWYVAQAPPEQTWTVPVPEGLRMPTMGFGAVWQAVPGVREALGFARGNEQAVSLSFQRFDGGSLLADTSAGQVFAFAGRSDGIVYGPF
ncbi:MAG: hypothetical protein SNJ59_04435 [Aggregatilineales bacterium]